jgi:hypothetical protein
MLICKNVQSLLPVFIGLLNLMEAHMICPNCGSDDCHDYRDKFICYSCKYHEVHFEFTDSMQFNDFFKKKPSLSGKFFPVVRDIQRNL